MNAADTLALVASTLTERGKQYETDPTAAGKERSMQSIVAAFQLLTGRTLSVREGWLFMVCLKMVRMQASPDKSDTYVDAIAYMALAAECVEAVADEVPKVSPAALCDHNFVIRGADITGNYLRCTKCGSKTKTRNKVAGT